MAKGENIFKRKDGRWEARYIRGYEISGKIRYGFCYGKTYREAKEKVTKCKAAMLAGNPVKNCRRCKRFSYYCEEWLCRKKSIVKESTYIKYDTILEKHIKPKLGTCFPQGMNSQLIDQFAHELLYEDQLSAKTVRDILTVLREILKYTEKQFEGAFPKIEVNYPKTERKEMRVLSPAEQAYFAAYLRESIDPCKFGILLALFTGIRIGELCALQWSNISPEDRTLRISSTMQRLRDVDAPDGARTRVVITAPKSSTSVRTIPLTKSITDLCAQMHPPCASAYVLTGTTRFMEPRALQYRFRKYLHACGFRDIHFHTLRHTFATRAVEAGFEIKSLSEILGHASTSITMDRYVHSSMELKRSNMEKMERME